MISALLVSLLLLFPWSGSAVPPPHPATALPSGATILGKRSLLGTADQEVVVYRVAGKTYLSLTVATSPARVLWRRAISGQFSRIVIPAPTGVFMVLTEQAPGASVYAFVSRNGLVRSAITGEPSGHIYGDEGAVVLPQGFQILSRDRRHQGSVRYRLVTSYELRDGHYVPAVQHRVPDYAPNAYPTPNALFHTQAGNTILLRLEIAATPQEQEYGLMNRPSLDPDSGMLFIWTSPVQESFWMKNTMIPLTVAFIGSDNRIQEMQDMQAETCTLHTPALPYQYAIEANLGYFSANGIKDGDVVSFHLNGPSTATPAPSPTPTATPPPDTTCR